MGLEFLAVDYQKDITGKYSDKKLIIAATARCVWDDLERLGGLDKYDVMCVNDMIMHYPNPVRHAYSNDWKMILKWTQARRPQYQKLDERHIITHSCFGETASFHWPWPGHGTSSLNAVYTGLALGYNEIILCGVPLDNSGHYFDPIWVKTNFEREVPYVERHGDHQIKNWQNARDKIFEGKVKSMSGRTKVLLGE